MPRSNGIDVPKKFTPKLKREIRKIAYGLGGLSRMGLIIFFNQETNQIEVYYEGR